MIASHLLRALLAAAAVCTGIPSHAAEWLRDGDNVDGQFPKWGIKGGLQFAIHPGGFTHGTGGPRGLVRMGYPTLPDGSCDLINFIAVEPIVAGRKGFSELEKSSIDGGNGKIFWTGSADTPKEHSRRPNPGTISILSPGVEELSVTVFVEKFDNGAHVRLKLSQRSDVPDELKLTVEAEPGSAAIESCILTATMGNKARTRLLFLSDGPVSSLQLYPKYRDTDFAPHTIFALERLPRTPGGDVLVAFANDESAPHKVQTHDEPFFWDYLGAKVTQYWRKPAAAVSQDLVCAVNGRFTYWMSNRPIPGGIAFENVELREPFKSGQAVIFGVTRKNPLEVLR